MVNCKVVYRNGVLSVFKGETLIHADKIADPAELEDAMCELEEQGIVLEMVPIYRENINICLINPAVV